MLGGAPWLFADAAATEEWYTESDEDMPSQKWHAVGWLAARTRTSRRLRGGAKRRLHPRRMLGLLASLAALVGAALTLLALTQDGGAPIRRVSEPPHESGERDRSVHATAAPHKTADEAALVDQSGTVMINLGARRVGNLRLIGADGAVHRTDAGTGEVALCVPTGAYVVQWWELGLGAAHRAGIEVLPSEIVTIDLSAPASPHDFSIPSDLTRVEVRVHGADGGHLIGAPVLAKRLGSERPHTYRRTAVDGRCFFLFRPDDVEIVCGDWHSILRTTAGRWHVVDIRSHELGEIRVTPLETAAVVRPVGEKWLSPDRYMASGHSEQRFIFLRPSRYEVASADEHVSSVIQLEPGAIRYSDVGVAGTASILVIVRFHGSDRPVRSASLTVRGVSSGASYPSGIRREIVAKTVPGSTAAPIESLRSGEYVLRLQAEGSREWSIRIRLDEGRTEYVTLTVGDDRGSG